MPTPDFEEWLDRQDIPIELQIDIEKYRDELGKLLDISKGSIDVAVDVYKMKYDILPTIGIRPIDITYETAYQKWTETRYAIKGEPGLWGAISAYQIAAERLRAMGEYEKTELAVRRWKSLEGLPTRRRYLYEG